MTNFTITQKINARGDEQFDIFNQDGQLVAFTFDEAHAQEVVDEMIRFPRWTENANCRFD